MSWCGGGDFFSSFFFNASRCGFSGAGAPTPASGGTSTSRTGKVNWTDEVATDLFCLKQTQTGNLPPRWSHGRG